MSGGGVMKIIRRINHNAALALDGNGNELVVLGKGIGFPQVPYELNDMSRVAKTFYDVDSRYMELIASLSQPILLASADIVEQAEINLESDLNPNLTFTLADHLNFAIDRIKKGIDVVTPFAYDVKHLYPAEYELGQLALDIVEDYVQFRLPEPEAVTVAIHLINAEVESGDMHSTLMTIKIMTDVELIIEKGLKIIIDRDSFQYSRFIMHLRYLIQRFSSGKQLQDGISVMLNNITLQYPDIYKCAQNILRYFKDNWTWECTQDEIFYLMIHIIRLNEKQHQENSI